MAEGGKGAISIRIHIHRAGTSAAAIVLLYVACYGTLAYRRGWIPLVPPAITILMTSAGIGCLTYRLRRP